MPAAALKVTMKVSRLSVDKTLALVFDMTGLDWSIVNGVVRVGDRRGSPQGALGQAHYVGDLMVVIRDFAAPGLGLMDAYPERPYTARELYGTGRVRQAPRLGFATQRLDQPFSDRTFVPLGTPQLESRPAFSRPIYRDRNRNAPWMVQRSAGGLSNPAVLIERLQAMTGGERVWERKGVGMRLLRGGRLWVVHTPELQQKIIAAIAKLRAGGQ